jgi:hypothetical protein
MADPSPNENTPEDALHQELEDREELGTPERRIASIRSLQQQLSEERARTTQLSNEVESLQRLMREFGTTQARSEAGVASMFRQELGESPPVQTPAYQHQSMHMAGNTTMQHAWGQQHTSIRGIHGDQLRPVRTSRSDRGETHFAFPTLPSAPASVSTPTLGRPREPLAPSDTEDPFGLSPLIEQYFAQHNTPSTLLRSTAQRNTNALNVQPSVPQSINANPNTNHYPADYPSHPTGRVNESMNFHQVQLNQHHDTLNQHQENLANVSSQVQQHGQTLMQLNGSMQTAHAAVHSSTQAAQATNQQLYSVLQRLEALERAQYSQQPLSAPSSPGPAPMHMSPNTHATHAVRQLHYGSDPNTPMLNHQPALQAISTELTAPAAQQPQAQPQQQAPQQAQPQQQAPPQAQLQQQTITVTPTATTATPASTAGPSNGHHHMADDAINVYGETLRLKDLNTTWDGRTNTETNVHMDAMDYTKKVVLHLRYPKHGGVISEEVVRARSAAQYFRVFAGTTTGEANTFIMDHFADKDEHELGTVGDLCNALINRFQVDTRTKTEKARLIVHNNKYHQGNQSIALYIHKFNQLMYHLPDMAESDRVLAFFRGLNDQLRPECTHDAQDRPFTTLAALQTHAKAKDDGQRLARLALNAAVFTTNTNTRKRLPDRQQDTKGAHRPNKRHNAGPPSTSGRSSGAPSTDGKKPWYHQDFFDHTNSKFLKETNNKIKRTNKQVIDSYRCHTCPKCLEPLGENQKVCNCPESKWCYKAEDGQFKGGKNIAQHFKTLAERTASLPWPWEPKRRA